MNNVAFNILSKINRWAKAKYESEDKITNDIVLELKYLVLKEELKAVFFHVPNESIVRSLGDVASAKKKHALGMINGAPDLLIANERDMLFIEVKTKTGKLSESQKLFQLWCEKVGVKYEVCRSVEDVIDCLKRNCFLPGGK